MSRNTIAHATMAAIAVAVGVSAQTPATQPQTPTAGASQTGATPRVTVEGCLVREEDVPGRKPNIVERRNVMEDYILTSTRIVKGSAPGSSAQSRPDQPTGTAGAAAGQGQRMYQVKGIDDARLKPLLGKRVEIEGAIQDLDKAPTPSAGNEDLADLQGSTIREVPGSCSK